MGGNISGLKVTSEQTALIKQSPIAPLWHSALLCLFFYGPILALSVLGPLLPGLQSRLVVVSAIEIGIYGGTLLLVAWGVDLYGTPWRRLFGEHWLVARAVLWSDAAVGLALLFISVFCSWVFVLVLRPNVPQSALAPSNAMELLAALLASGFAAFSEEVFFRGYALRQIYSLNCNWAFAISLQAAAFVLAHGLRQTAVEVFLEFFVGMAFGVATVWRRSLLPSIVAHVTLNGAAVLVAFASR